MAADAIPLPDDVKDPSSGPSLVNGQGGVANHVQGCQHAPTTSKENMMDHVQVESL